MSIAVRVAYRAAFTRYRSTGKIRGGGGVRCLLAVPLAEIDGVVRRLLNLAS
jgi:hypothetical protein